MKRKAPRSTHARIYVKDKNKLTRLKKKYGGEAKTLHIALKHLR